MKKEENIQIVHEAETTRQHARYKIPATIIIEGKEYKVYDWSVSGCSIIDLPKEYLNKKMVIGEMVFRFDNFETRVKDLKLEFVSSKKIGSIEAIGARFTDINMQQISVLNEIITAFLTGDIVTEDDIIHAVSRTQTYPKKIEAKIDKGKAWGILFIIYLTILLLLLFLGYVIYKNTFIVQTSNGYIDTNLTVIRSPAPSYIVFDKKFKIGEDINISQNIALAYFVSGGVQEIISPVEGKIYKINAKNQEFRDVGEPICTIVDKNYSVFIVANILHENLNKIKIGFYADIILPDGEKIEAKIVKMEPAQTPTQDSLRVIKNIYSFPKNYDKVYFEPVKKLDLEMVDKSVFISIDTFKNRYIMKK